MFLCSKGGSNEDFCFKDWDSDGEPAQGRCPEGHLVCGIRTRVK